MTVSVPQSRAQQGVTREDLRAMTQEIAMAVTGRRDQPVRVEGEVTLDGEKVGRMEASRRRSERRRRGFHASPHEGR